MKMLAIIRDGQHEWATPLDELLVALEAEGWSIDGDVVTEPEPDSDDDDESSRNAYSDLCGSLASVGGEGSTEPLPEREACAAMVYAQDLGPGCWRLYR
jgi:hypothetical protein